jgi:hypothetical protein
MKRTHLHRNSGPRGESYHHDLTMMGLFMQADPIVKVV